MVATTALRTAGPALYNLLARGMTDTFAGLKPTDLTMEMASSQLLAWSLVFVKAILPVGGVILIGGLAFGLLQGGLAISWKPVMPDFGRVNPAAGFARLFSLRSLTEQIKALLKLGIIGLIGYREVVRVIPQVPNLMGQNVAAGVVGIAARAVSGLQSIGFGLLTLGALDYGYQYWEFRKSLRMTKQEVKQEHKQQEGNPELKQKQRQKAREMARRRKALQAVPEADVIITNPTHYAVAIRYAAGKDAAPRVVAKGTDLLAQRIKVIARQHDVPAVENRPLARTLYRMVDVDEAVPEELYQAVAEVLAFVYSLRRQNRRPHSS